MNRPKKPVPEYLRLHVEQSPPDEPSLDSSSDGESSVQQLLKQLGRATGWQFKLASSSPSRCPATLAWSSERYQLGHQPPWWLELHRQPASGAQPRIRLQLEQAVEIATAVGEVLHELHSTRNALWQREAELAASVPVVPRTDESEHLALRLEAVLRSGVDAVQCHAAALYLLDDATSQLKLRAAWGLPPQSLLDPPRPLGDAIADLEALLGHVVVLHADGPTPAWQCPEPFQSAVCVPVSTPSIPLGTLWVYSRHRRDFSDQETNLIEIVAGRLATDLEREVLLSSNEKNTHARQAIDTLVNWQQQQFPHVAPLLDNWELAGSTPSSRSITPLFHDWAMLDDKRLLIAVGGSLRRGADGAMLATQLRGALQLGGQLDTQPERLLSRINRMLYATSVGDQQASLLCGVLDIQTGCFRYAAAGEVAGICIQPKRRRQTAPPDAALGISDQSVYRPHRLTLPPGAVLLLAGGSAVNQPDAAGRHLLAQVFERQSALPYKSWQWVRWLEDRFRQLVPPQQMPPSLLVLRRRHSCSDSGSA